MAESGEDGNETGEAITAEGLEALKAEIEQLEGEGREAMAARLKTARELGDLKENAEYHIAKEDQAHLETRIKRLRERLANAVVIEADAESDERFSFGATAEVTDSEGRTRTWKLVGSTEADLGHAVIEVRDVGRARHRTERQAIASEMEAVRRVAGVEHELRRRRRDQGFDERRVEPDHLAVGRRAGTDEEGPGLVVEHLHTELAEDPERGLVDRLDLVGRRQLGRPVEQPRLRERPLLRHRGSGPATGAVTPTAATTM